MAPTSAQLRRAPAPRVGVAAAPKSALRVLHVIPGEEAGASMIFAKREAQALEQAGLAVQLFFLRSRTSPLHVFAECRRLRQVLRQFRPDIVHAQFGTMTGFLTAYATRMPVVVTFRGSDLNPDPGVTRARSVLARCLSQLAALRAARIICVSSQLRSRLWWKQDRVTVLPGSVDLEEFRPMPQQPARAVLSWATDERVVVFNSGGARQVKRLDLAHQAVAHASEALSSVRLAVLDGTVAPESVPYYLNAADCLLVASDWEGSPTIVREALACNLPIVSVEVGDVPERVAGVSHCVIAERDPAKLGEALVQILRSKSRSNGRDRVRELSVEHFNEQLTAVYRSVFSSAAPQLRAGAAAH